MRRPQLEALLRELGRVTGRDEVVIVGSQCVHAVTDAAPAEVLVSLECDLLVDPADAVAAIDEALGPTSAFRAEHGVYVDTVEASFPFLPDGWDARLRLIDAGAVRARCLEVHDLVVSKLAAGRLKDYELVAALIARGIVDAGTARARIVTASDQRMRAILLARLQIALESIGRG